MRQIFNSTTASDGPGEVTTRRTMLRRLGSAGLIATAGTGLLTLARPGRALAQTNLAHISNTTGLPMTSSCCVICSEAEFHCNGGEKCAGSGECCYFCDGCGLDGFYCIDSHGCQPAVELCS
jgi:hypothetical protein